MKAVIIQTASFTNEWRSLGLTDDDLRSLEKHLMDRPDAGAVVTGTGGVRKIRFALRGKGKSGGVRVVYAWFVRHAVLALVMVFAKSEQGNLTPTEKEFCRRWMAVTQQRLNER